MPPETENVNVADHNVLLRCATEAGVDVAEARRMLDSDRYTAEVSVEGAALGVTGVPTVVVDRREELSGAVAVEDYLALLARASAAAQR